MGSLISSPKTPKAQETQIVYVPPAATTTTTETVDTTPEDSSAKKREDNLLRRTRGRLGTVATGLQGVLSERENKKPRKTLLGE